MQDIFNIFLAGPVSMIFIVSDILSMTDEVITGVDSGFVMLASSCFEHMNFDSN